MFSLKLNKYDYFSPKSPSGWKLELFNLALEVLTLFSLRIAWSLLIFVKFENKHWQILIKSNLITLFIPI